MMKEKLTIRVPNSCVVQTPQLLAGAMVQSLGCTEGETWLEPCVGEGALLTALSSQGVKKANIVGLDVDGARRPTDRLGNVLRGTEFLKWSRSTELRFDKVIANPPYVAIERLQKTIRNAALEASLSEEIKITANGNAWYAFLCSAIHLLKRDGSLCFLLPAAWDFANYAMPLRKSIADYFSSVEVYRTAKPIFRAEGVQEGSILLVARGRRNPVKCEYNEANVFRQDLDSIDDLIKVLAEKRPYKGFLKPTDLCAPAIHALREQQHLGDLIRIRLGVVTGDSSYFLLKESRRKELQLPVTAVIPILSKAKHLVSSQISSAQWERLRDDDQRVWLFNPPPQTMTNRFVQSYLEFGRDGGCRLENHKVAIRKPWFRFSISEFGDAFVSGMSTRLPLLSFRMMPRLAATNTLYIASFADPLLEQRYRVGIAMSLLSSAVREQMESRGRQYAAGLLKFEPSDLLNLNVPAVRTVASDWSSYKRAVQALNEGNEARSREIADGAIKLRG